MKPILILIALFMMEVTAGFDLLEDGNVVIYKSEHDIVKIVTFPLNLNKTEWKNSYTFPDQHPELFFVEADIDDKGYKEYKGLYFYGNGTSTKLLDHGTDISAHGYLNKEAYFGAKDGMYIYNADKNKAEKYGSVTDNIIGIAKEEGADVIYILTNDHDLYKVTENGNKKTKVNDVKNAQQIALDQSNNLYFYGPDKQLHVMIGNEVRKVDGLPENPNNVKLQNSQRNIVDKGVLFVADTIVYKVNENAVDTTTFNLVNTAESSAISLERLLVIYYAINKTIYKCDIRSLLCL